MADVHTNRVAIEALLIRVGKGKLARTQDGGHVGAGRRRVQPSAGGVIMPPGPICGNRDIEDLVTSLADYASLFRPQLKIRMLDVVIEHTRFVAHDEAKSR